MWRDYETAFHQDYPSHPFDRSGNMAFWIALDEVTPEHGSMRFLNGSHRAGALGRYIEAGQDLLAENPWLREEYEFSEPLHYRPGDATVHHGLVVHGAGRNTAATPRWGYVASYFPADTLFTGAPWLVAPADPPLRINEPLDNPHFPLVYAVPEQRGAAS